MAQLAEFNVVFIQSGSGGSLVALLAAAVAEDSLTVSPACRTLLDSARAFSATSGFASKSFPQCSNTCTYGR